MRYAGKAFQYVINGIGIFVGTAAVVELIIKAGPSIAIVDLISVFVAVLLISFRVEEVKK